MLHKSNDDDNNYNNDATSTTIAQRRTERRSAEGEGEGREGRASRTGGERVTRRRATADETRREGECDEKGRLKLCKSTTERNLGDPLDRAQCLQNIFGRSWLPKSHT